MSIEKKITVLGFELSNDYSQLYELIHKGYRIPAWILYTDVHEEPIFDLVEVKLSKFDVRYMIGTRGIGYESFGKNVEEFKKDCERINLQFVIPKPE